MALSGLTVEIDKEPNACLIPLQGEGRDGDGFKVKSKAPPSKSSPLGEDFTATALKNSFQLLTLT